jgi:hypothetical protein
VGALGRAQPYETCEVKPHRHHHPADLVRHPRRLWIPRPRPSRRDGQPPTGTPDFSTAYRTPQTIESPAHMTTHNEASVGVSNPGSVGESRLGARRRRGGPPGFVACAPRGRTLRLHVLDGTVLVGQFELREAVLMQSPSCYALWARRTPYRRRRYGQLSGSSPSRCMFVDASDWWISHPGRTLM